MSGREAEPELVVAFPVLGGAFLMAGRASTLIKQALERAGVDPALARRVGVCAYEAEMNMVVFCRSGMLTLELYPDLARVVAQDRGPGIPDIEQAMQPGYSTASEKVRQLGFGAGMGLPNIRRNADGVEISTTLGLGTRLVMTFKRE